MTIEKRNKNYPMGLWFYMVIIGIFASISLISLGCCFIGGFTDERIVVILMNAWFMLFTMDIVTVRFKRSGEHSFWHDWIIFNKKQTSTDIIDTDLQKKAG